MWWVPSQIGGGGGKIMPQTLTFITERKGMPSVQENYNELYMQDQNMQRDKAARP